MTPFPTGQRDWLVQGVTAEARGAALAALAARNPPTTAIILIADPRHVAETASEVRTFLSSFYPELGRTTDVLPEPPPPDIDAARRAEHMGDRLAVLTALIEDAESPQPGARLLFATPEAVLGPCPERHALDSRRLRLRPGDERPMTDLVAHLASELDYDAEALCESPGQLATRGGLLDIYPFDADRPYRIDFFGDEIESIRAFDPASQRSAEEVDSLPVAPSPLAGKLSAEDGNFLAYLPDNGVLWMLVEPPHLVREHPYRFEDVPGQTTTFRSFHQVFEQRKGRGDRRIGICSIDTGPPLFAEAARASAATEPTADYRAAATAMEPGEAPLDTPSSIPPGFAAQLRRWATIENLRLCFLAESPSEEDRIRRILANDPKTADLKPRISHGTLAAGFLLRATPPWFPIEESDESDGLVVLPEHELLGRQRRKTGENRGRARPNISRVDQMLDFTTLADGDVLVHLQHGICLFRGLSTLTVGDCNKEVITVEFADQVTIHVPLHESHLLTRYIGLKKGTPTLGKVGGTAWEKTRRAAEAATLDYAAELLHLHARRDRGEGYAFPPDHEWQQTFEENFPFRETPDQQRAIGETKADMEAARPMDRLICGDVGFGKTEVALRAAFKAVLAGRQVAVLAPTTVLCQQHLNTFSERMADYPVLIESVSRFRTAAQNKKTLADLAAGRIDLVIGTHRLLSRDVHFHNLGLLIVDEEQRFGVRQKERIKQLRANVDILTLSATPIPRTLYLALSGARSMSVIETPPVDRRPIETIVRPYSHAIVNSAIQAETDRGGQVFYLHNRVATIESVAKSIREAHPRLRIAVGHGQMEEKQLEKIMTRFVAGDYDVLVCTTIIESGIDIPNCNTLIIEGADRFGLAQLYQIRGRVGRFKRQAYAYLLLHRHAALVDQAQKRLNALKQHNQLGAGFRIAMRDLELRGAGNLLGARQSGHIAGVGFELYCKLLKQSVARLNGEAGADRIRAEVQLDFVTTGEAGKKTRRISGSANVAALKEAEPGNREIPVIEASLPADYLAEAQLRIDFYRRLGLAESEDDVADIADELADRFGRTPPPVQALLTVTRIRIRAESAGVRRVETEGDRLICRLAKPAAPEQFLKAGPRFPRLSSPDPGKRLEEILRFLNRHTKNTQRPMETASR